MNLLFDSFWRALADCLRPRMLLLSFVPLLVMAVVSTLLLWLAWDPAVQAVQGGLARLGWLESLLRWIEGMGLAQWRGALAQLLVLMLALPLLLILSLLSVSWFLTPAVVSLVAQRRFPALVRRQGGSFWGGMLLSVWWSVLALAGLVLSMPLWLVPPLVLVLPALIWGWLNYRVMSHDVLSVHADAGESAQIIGRHRLLLLALGVLTGYLGAAPGVIWAIGAMALVLAPVLIPLSIWIYSVIFVFSALWFTHFCLAALQQLRDGMPTAREQGAQPASFIEILPHEQR